MTRFQITDTPPEDRTPEAWTQPYRPRRAANVAVDRLPGSGPWSARWRGRPDDTPRRRARRDVFRKLILRLLRHAQPGDVMVLENRVGRKVIVRAIRTKPRWRRYPKPAGAHPLIAEVYQFVHHKFPEAMDWGTCNCRRNSANLSLWSQHSRWADGCRATDPGVPTLELGDRIAAAVREKFGDRVGIVWRTTAHYDHLHLEVRPAKTGTPVCAGGTN